MNILSAIFAAAVTALLCTVLKERSPGIALLISVGGVVYIIYKAADKASELSGKIKDLFPGGAPEYFEVLIRALLICAAAEAVSNICEDAGEKALSGGVLFLGKAAALYTALPLFFAVFEIIGKLLEL